MKTAFILSTGRTGTRFLAEFLDELDGVTARHEPAPRFFRLGNDYACLPRRQRRRQAAGRVSFAAAVEAVAQQRAAKLAAEGVDYYVEANNRLWSLAPVLRYVFPGCRLVRIVRDGRDVVRSGMGRGWYTERDPFDRIRAVDCPDDAWADRWGYMTRFEKVCWWWVKKDSVILAAFGELRYERCLTVRFEDVFDPALNFVGLRKLLGFLELHDAAERITPARMRRRANATAEHSFPHWRDWDPDTRRQFERVAGEHMLRVGYDLW